jgi:hypothetical protein
MVWCGLTLFTALASASTLAPREDPDAALKTIHDAPKSKVSAEERDAGLMPVPFTAKEVRASSRFVLSPDLRDPFLVAQDEHAKKQRASRIDGDLRDPFAQVESQRKTPADLRDPFEAPRDAAPCAPQTSDGVQIQRPKSMRGC